MFVVIVFVMGLGFACLPVSGLKLIFNPDVP